MKNRSLSIPGIDPELFQLIQDASRDKYQHVLGADRCMSPWAREVLRDAANKQLGRK